MDYNWDKARAAAAKILLPNHVVLPDEAPDIKRVRAAFQYALTDFNKLLAANMLVSNLASMRTWNAKMQTVFKQFLAQIQKSDFNLNPKNKDDLKKIQQARKILCDVLNHVLKDYLATNDQIFGGLAKDVGKVDLKVPRRVIP